MKDEFYKSNEYNKTSEYLHFPAEIYTRKIEENTLGKEEVDVGAEVTTLQKAKKERSQRNNSQKNFMDKIFNSIKGATTVSTVALATVCGSSIVLPDLVLGGNNAVSNQPRFEMSISNVLFSGLNEVTIYFDHSGIESDCVLEFDYGEGIEKEVIPLTKRNLNDGYVTTPIASTAEFVSIQPIVKYDNGKTMALESYQRFLERSLDADVIVNTVNGWVDFYLKGITGNATSINVMNLATNEIETQELYWDSVAVQSVSAFYEVGSVDLLNYSVFLTDEQGEKVSEEYTVSIDTTKTMENDSHFNFVNTGDVGITYNEDGTINVYVNTQFETANEELYYMITIGDNTFISRDKIFCALGLPNENYSLTYDICFSVDGIRYSILSTTPSGTINEMTFEGVLDATLEEDVLNLSIYSFIAEKMDLNKIWLTTSSGERIDVQESDFIYNADFDQYECSITLTNEFEFIDIYVVHAPYAKNMERIENYEGSLSATFHKRIDKN